MLPGAHRQVHRRASGVAIYWYAWRGGPQIATFRAATLAEAEALELAGADQIAAGYAAEHSPAAPDGTVARLVQAFLQSPEWAQSAEATKVSRRKWLDTVTQRWGHMSGVEFASDAVAAEIAAWRDEIGRVSPSSAQKAMEAVSRLCSYGRSRERPEGVRLPRDCNPTADFSKIYTAPVQLPPPRQIVLDAIERLPPLASAICAIMLNSGLRRSDLVRLCDTHVDTSAGVIRIDPLKSRHRRRLAVIRLTPDLLAAIRSAQALREAACARKDVKPLHVVVNSRGAPFTPNGLYNHLKDAFAAAGLPLIRPHDFRRAAATQRYMAGLSWAQIGREMGWGESQAQAMGDIYVPDEAMGGNG